MSKCDNWAGVVSSDKYWFFICLSTSPLYMQVNFTCWTSMWGIYWLIDSSTLTTAQCSQCINGFVPTQMKIAVLWYPVEWKKTGTTLLKKIFQVQKHLPATQSPQKWNHHYCKVTAQIFHTFWNTLCPVYNYSIRIQWAIGKLDNKKSMHNKL